MQLKWPMLWDLFSLFPAYAGVIPMSRIRSASLSAFPRIRGGDPWIVQGDRTVLDFSPHTRG